MSSNLILNWSALAATVVLFAILYILKKRRVANFAWRTIIATAFGIIIGLIFHAHTDYVALFGTVWSNAIKAIVVPLLLFSIIASLSNLSESVRLKNIGLKSIFFLMLNTLTAAGLALILGSIFHVGRGFHYAPTGFKPEAVPSVLDTLVGLFPSNLAANWSNNQVVPVVILAIVIAIAYNKVAATEKGAESVASFKSFIDAGNKVLGKATQIIIGFTPYAVLSLIAAALSNANLLSLLPLVTVLIIAYVAILIQLFIIQPLILTGVTGLNPVHFFKRYWTAGIVAFTSESSIGTIPVTVAQLKKMGVSGDIASFVASLGANLGMPGCAGIWPVLVAVFTINSQGLHYGVVQYIFLIVLTLLVSVGTVGVPGTATITTTSLFAAAGLPIAYIGVMQPISQIADMARTALNVAGAANSALIVAKTENELDLEVYKETKAYVEEDEEVLANAAHAASHV